MKLIIFTGPPASGKSSLSSDIAKDLKIDCISKDLFKMHLFDKYGFKNHDEKKLLSIKGEAMMYRVIKFYISRNKDLIIDNNFKEFDTLRSLLNANNRVENFNLNLDNSLKNKIKNKEIVAKFLEIKKRKCSIKS